MVAPSEFLQWAIAFGLYPPSGGGGNGTVTSVSSGTGLTGGPITTSGTLSFAPIALNSYWANVSGVSGVPTVVTLPSFTVLTVTQVVLDATYANGTAGVGATLTDASGTFAPFANDGVVYSLNETILVTDQGDGVSNGVYTLTTNGDGVSVPWVLTRSVAFNKSSQFTPGTTFPVSSGLLHGAIYVQIGDRPITIGTDLIAYNSMYDLVLAQQPPGTLLGNPTGSMAYATPINIGTGLSLSGDTLSATGGGLSSWQTITAASVNAVSGDGIVADRTATPVQVVLPATFAVGDEIAVLGSGAGGWTVVANSGQTIKFMSATTSVAGSISSDIQYANIFLRGLVANTTWTVELVNSEPTYV